MMIRLLARHELARVWSIDRAEVIEEMVACRGGELVWRAERHEVEEWPPGEPEKYGPLLLACFDRGGSCYGVFEGGALAGVAVLESRFLASGRDRLQLVFMHVDRRHRGRGLGSRLFERVVARAREQGARRLYVSATPSANTIRFYLHRGFRPAREPDPELFALEPEDIHMELELRASCGARSVPR